MRLTFFTEHRCWGQCQGHINIWPGRALTYKCFMSMPADDLPLHQLKYSLFHHRVDPRGGSEAVNIAVLRVFPGYQLASENKTLIRDFFL